MVSKISAAADTIMVGVVGNLQPDKPEFKEYLTAITKTTCFSAYVMAISGATTQWTSLQIRCSSRV